MITRRGLIGSIGALIAAPAIVRASSLMPVRVLKPFPTLEDWATLVADRVINPPLYLFSHAPLSIGDVITFTDQGLFCKEASIMAMVSPGHWVIKDITQAA